ncbi:cupredoxin domain-containing protein [Streptomyces sp. HSW2009]|uniref:cupredoxin domain-containing protein n=1 Tax=Streptomyces sp. HSW2009 TaxID=3142890 RepID=UPI0032F06D6D
MKRRTVLADPTGPAAPAASADPSAPAVRSVTAALAVPAAPLFRLIAALLAALSLGLLLQQPSAAASTAVRPAAEVIVIIEDGRFVPQDVTIRRGDTVRWTNNDRFDHTVTSSDGLGWDSGVLTPGQSFRRTFPVRGVFRYHDRLNPSITGLVAVR